MAYLQLDGQQFQLVPGDNGVGSAPAAAVPLTGGGVADHCAVIALGADGSSVIRRAGPSTVTVNGLPLGAEPVPLIHGDKIEIAGRELIFGDDRKGGNTQYVAAVRMPELARQSPAAARAAAATGGRLVSLVDGREYLVPSAGLVLGRDAACDVVVPTGEVSRKHAVIAPGPEGYVLTDTSTNGVQVNGTPFSSPGTLRRGDVLTIGAEEFRFYADDVPPATSAAEGVGAGAPVAAPAAEAAVAPAAPAAVDVRAAPVSPPGTAVAPSTIDAPRAVLATLEVTSTGILRGTRFDLRSPLTHVGRGAHNEVVLADESVSDSHAKLQRREAGWFVVDMDSTNGTYVGGRRITGEALLTGAPDLRFGGVKVIFRATGEGDGVGAQSGQTRAIAALKGGGGAEQLEQVGASVPRVGSRPQRPSEPPRDEARRAPVLFWVVVLALVAFGAILLLKGR